MSAAVVGEEALTTLLDACVNAHVVSERIKDGGKLLKRVQNIKDAFLLRKDEIYRADTAGEAVNKSLVSLKDTLYTLDEKIKKLRQKSILLPTSVSRKRKKMERIVDELQNAWNALMVDVTLSIAGRSSQQALEANGNIAKIALASGHPDWEILDRDQAEQICMQGDKFMFGYGVRQSYDTAFKRYMAAAKFGLADACNMIASMYEKGLGRQVDLPNAVFWYKEAAAKGHAESCNHLGRLHELGKGVPCDIKLAAEYYVKAAEKNHADAQTNIGHLLERGLGHEQDYARAASWYRLAAEQEYARAQNALGSLYYRGLGVTGDDNEAVQWFRLSAEQGNPNAQNNLGICYEEGRGVARDYVLARQWYSRAAESQHPNATNNVGYLYLLEQQYDNALRHFHLAAALGSIDALFNLGNMYENGLGVPLDVRFALRYYEQSAEQDYAKAQAHLGTLYCSGIDGVLERDHNLALDYFRRAAVQGDPIAQNGLGQMYELGLGVAASTKSAAKWYLKAANQGNPTSLYNLATLYETGTGLEHADIRKALHLYREAEKRGHLEARSRIEAIRSTHASIAAEVDQENDQLV